MKFYTEFDRPVKMYEENSGEIRTERAGYIPAERQIQDMINAGLRLAKSRQGYEFRSSEDIPEDYYDPTRSQNFDMADATVILRSLETKAKDSSSTKKVVDKEPSPTKKVVEKEDDKPLVVEE